ncbi:Splicing factor 1 [Fasciola hepatica]|uniref:Splicing factor 1 n=1 Tax=Fasciola hepatica TaxID=6192 RepID=A0A4E0RE02_FASHE|nr:Splicing factor 1 [Fasciola hepatica]
MAYIDQLNNNPTERAKMDSEYSALMAELGVGAASQFLNSGMGRGGGLRAPRPPRQPPPPGVAPTEEEEDDTNNTSTVNGSTSTATVSSTMANTADPYGYKLPPPPIPPMMPSVGGWPTAGMMMPQMASYPPAAGYPPVPPTGGTGVYTVPPASSGATTHGGASWPTTTPTHTWGDSGTMPPPPIPYGASAMVPSPYGSMAGNYWGTTAMYPSVVPNPPPPPPPGV